MIMKKILFIFALTLGLFWGGVGKTSDLEPYLGDDGIYHYDWFHQSFLELADDLADAQDQGKHLMVKFDQKGCIYCEKIALEVLAEPAINKYVRENFVVVQMDLFGNKDVTDFDGTVLDESRMAQRWGVMFTPTIYFVSDRGKADRLVDAIDASMPGAFGKGTFFAMLKWVREGGPENDELFQKYLIRNMNSLRAEMDAAKQS